MPHPVRGVYFDHIEPRLQLLRILLQPFLRGGGQFLPLGKGHKLTRLGKCGVFAQLHLRKDHISPVGGDHIQLAEAGTVIHGKNAAALFPQVFRRERLAVAAEQHRAAQCIFLRYVGRWIGDGPYSRSAA